MRPTLYGLCVLLLISPWLTGCARYPAGGDDPNAPPVTIRATMTVAGQINPAYYYFLAIDTDNNDGDGPIPVISDEELSSGWGTISGLGPNDPITVPPFFVVYNAGSFQMYRDGQPIGPPYSGEVLSNRSGLVIEVDARELVPESAALPTTLQLNWITMKDLTIPPQDSGFTKEYDGIGPSGTDYVYAIPLDQNWIRASGDEYGTPPEYANDTTETKDIDLIGWSIETRLR